ncbi:bifunctional chorismate mutase/prephenate dehydratase [Helicobacter saguini]|uniref:Bifunctional chorismate mutase/prephenate dehydratase n=1 Tax=Helicobacter saguini TaxID=1548018 RepID=A0A347VT59_9HELI|nr:bifunctional chorismate mutase/prephenate dehydratase [Helicobacter saguini]MWV62227.1 bifunctional chorismate mutase/prephenate dehydratase [Helicobacter saguini]MWV67100.1 bifunctional chorismate mutase/prephenate dehydratase [Helicobacter saguini]MWV69450.1 bifunctional chorismate mutase/prephenate dehydratase [Helicobacter saguini]MWV70997.1 bifunctional chorismate mutase/prephenate dehydratase [Helicobacter saguini]TLD92919.1 bifunctional chorismate mutase/prephenate dehydratase [Helic
MESKLSKIRNNIDKIDKEIITLLNSRFKYVKEIGEIKLKNNASIYRPDREKEIIKKLTATARDCSLENINTQIIEAIFYEIFSIARNLESPQKVAFLGPLGSFTQEAAHAIFGNLSEYVGLSSISAVFDALQHGNAKYGVVPIENNTNGVVGECIDNLARYDFKIINEIILPIHHCFACACELSEVKRIYTKDIVFGQCSDFLRDYNLQNVERIETSSTAIGASKAAADKAGAALCSAVAANLVRIPIMFSNVENSSQNKTRFVVISDFSNKKGENNKTSIFVVIKDFEKSGALFQLLKDFKEENINITKIDSRPIVDKDGFKYGFYMDFLGHKDDSNIQKIFKKRANEIKWLGSYPAFE